MATFTRAQSGADADTLSGSASTRAATATATISPQPASTSTVVAGAVERAGTQATEAVVSGAVERSRPQALEAVAGAEVVTYGTPGSRYRADRLRPFTMGLFLPDSFRDVPVEIVDPDGERITDTVWVLTSAAFGTASKVEDGRGTVTMVAGLGYEQFIGIGDRAATPEVDYAWYSVDEQQETIVPPVEERKQIVLKPRQIAGMWTGGGFDKGGQLR